MKQTRANGKRFVISRQRGQIELVDENGEISFSPFVSALIEVSRSVVPGITPFALRPRSFLSDLRAKRDLDLGRRQKAKRLVVKRDPAAPRPRRKSQKTLASEALATLPFDLAAILAKGKVSK